MMVNHGIDVEAAVVGVFDLAHNLPSQVVMRLARRVLHFAIDSEPHRASHLMNIEFRFLPFAGILEIARGESHAAETCGLVF